MKTIAFAAALLLGGSAFAQGQGQAGTAAAPGAGAYDGDGVTAPFETGGQATPAAATMESGAAPSAPAAGALVQPGNSSPERDSRGIAVISAPAVVPAGWNGTPAAATGGPLLDPDSGEPIAARDYPACSAAVTDRCLQTYERQGG